MSCRRAEQWHAHMRPRLGRYPEQLTQSDWPVKIPHAGFCLEYPPGQRLTCALSQFCVRLYPSWFSLATAFIGG